MYLNLYLNCLDVLVDMTILFCALQDDLKAKWEVGKAVLEEAKNEAERKYKEINEQVSAL